MLLISISMTFLFVFSATLFSQNRPYNVVAKEEESRKKKVEEEEVAEKVGLKVLLNYTMLNSSSFFSGNGDNLSLYADTNIVPGKTIAYGFNNVSHNLDLYVGYEFYENLTLGVGLPFSLIYYDENYLDHSQAGSVTDKVLRYENSITQLDFLSLNASYLFTYQSYFTEFKINVAIPTADEPKFGDSASFSRYFPFAFSPQISSGIKSDKYALVADLGYRLRAGEYSDMLLANLNFILTTVPDTEVRAFINTGYSLDPIDKTAILDFRHNPYSEMFAKVGFAFKILIEKTYFAEFIYRITVWGINTRNTAGYAFVVGLNL